MPNSDNSIDPYKSPETEFSQPIQRGTYEPHFFSKKGRLGRLRYIAYSAGYLLGFLIVFSVLSSTPSIIFIIKTPILSFIALALLYLPILIICFNLAIRRFNDINLTGWFCFLLLIPIAGSFMFLVLLFVSGSDGANKYGPAPTKNSTAIKIIASCALLISVVGILAAFTIPADQSYVERIKQILN